MPLFATSSAMPTVTAISLLLYLQQIIMCLAMGHKIDLTSHSNSVGCQGKTSQCLTSLYQVRPVSVF